VAAVEVGGADHFGVHPAENEQEQIHKLITGNATKNHIKKSQLVYPITQYKTRGIL
jgi:hypothetical protein